MAKSGKKPAKSSAPKSKPTPVSATKPAPTDYLDREPVQDSGAPLWKKIFWGVAAFGLLLMLFMALGSGINADDKFQNDYAQKLVAYYSTMGKDTAALNVPDGNMHLYGGFFEVVTGFTNKALGFTEDDRAYHNVRHLYSAFFGWIAILCAALLARHIAGWRAGFFTLALLLVSPRLVGDSLMNPKDIPFAAGYMLALYNMVRVLDAMPRPGRWHVAGLVGGLAMALALRAGGLLSFAYLFMFAGLYLVLRRGFGSLFDGKVMGRYLWVIGGAAVAGYLLAVFFWPYALQNPLRNPFIALSKFSELEVKIRVLYEGLNVMSDSTPWHYPVKWILLTIPLSVIAGLAIAVVTVRRLLAAYSPLWIGLLAFAGVFPVFYIIYKDSVIHDGWRHLTFSYPPLAALAGVAWNDLARRFEARMPLKAGVFAAFGLLSVDAAWFVAANPAFPYVYFNPIAGGVKGAYGHYETDYWGVSTRQGIGWLEKEGILKEGMQDKVVIATNMYYGVKKLCAKYGDKVVVKYLKWEKRCDDAWDYALYPTRFLDGQTLQKDFWPPDNAVHIVKAGGAPLLAVLKDSDKNCSLGMAAAKLGDWEGSISYLKKEVENVPDNDLAWANLAQAYLNNQQLEEAKSAAEKALEISPDDVQANNLIGMYWMYQNDDAKARSQFEAALKKEPSNPAAYYYLALIAQKNGDNQTALNNLMKAIQTAPTFKAAYDMAARIYESQGNAAAAQQFRAAMQQIR